MVGSADSPAGGRFPPPPDLGSEKRNDMRIEGVYQFHNLVDKGITSERSNSDTYVGLDEFDKFHSRKIYRGGSGSDHHRRSDDVSKALKPTSYISQEVLPHQARSNSDEYSSVWDQAITMNAPGYIKHPSYIPPFARQVYPVTFRDTSTGPLVMSHVAADEGSGNGMNEAGVWNFTKSTVVSDKINPKSTGHVSELSGAFVAGMKSKSRVHLPEPDSPIPGRTKSSSSNRQMTIFYDGHAYVFDDVHPYKAEMILSMAGSNSTTPTKSSLRQDKKGSTPTGKIETGSVTNTDLSRDQRAKCTTGVNSFIPNFRSGDQIPTLAGTSEYSRPCA